MHMVFALARFLPYWAFPVALLTAEVGWYFHRKKSSSRYYFWTISALLIIVLFCWIGFRGDIHSDGWVRSFLEDR